MEHSVLLLALLLRLRALQLRPAAPSQTPAAQAAQVHSPACGHRPAVAPAEHGNGGEAVQERIMIKSDVFIV